MSSRLDDVLALVLGRLVDEGQAVEIAGYAYSGTEDDIEIRRDRGFIVPAMILAT